MAATDRTVRYMAELDPMVDWVRRHLSTVSDGESRSRTHQALGDFCRNYPASFRDALLARLDLMDIERLPAVENTAERIRVEFADVLSQQTSSSVFLLRDAYQLFRDHRDRTGGGLTALVNRSLLTGGDESRYFALVGLIYQALLRSEDFNGFYAVYLDLLKRLIDRDKFLHLRSTLVAEYVKRRVRGRSLLWIDVGAQFTFVLFCLGSLELHQPGEWNQDVFTLTAWPWMQQRFSGRYFSDRCEHLYEWEQEARRAHVTEREDKVAGLMAGFAVGDALGAPAAGVETEQVRRVFPAGLSNHATHREHPLLGHLKAGQYTENTRLLVLSARSLAANRGFAPGLYAKDLAEWAAGIMRNGKDARWPGPTALEAGKKLASGVDWRSSGSLTTGSCSCAYRVLPFGVFYGAIDDAKRLTEWTDIAASMTHGSSLSRACAQVTASLVAELLRWSPPTEAVRVVLESSQPDAGSEELFERLQVAVAMAAGETDAAARKRFGTSSRAVQTLPLSIFFLLRYPSDFAGAVRAGANSWRVDSPLARKTLRGLSPVDQMIVCEGGNTDGIAALTGAFVGCAIGASRIPPELGDVEDRELLGQLATELALGRENGEGQKALDSANPLLIKERNNQ